MKRSELETLVRSMVKEQLKETLDARVGIIIAELVAELVEDKLNEAIDARINRPAAHTLKEAVGAGEVVERTSPARPRPDRSKLAAMLGYDTPTPAAHVEDTFGSRDEITVDYVIGNDEDGTPRPIDPRAIPVEFRQAINRDYRSFLKKLNENTARSRGTK